MIRPEVSELLAEAVHVLTARASSAIVARRILEPVAPIANEIDCPQSPFPRHLNDSKADLTVSAILYDPVSRLQVFEIS
jgi:hypothetical protein